MTPPPTTKTSATLSTLALAMLVVGLFETAAVGWIIVRDGLTASTTTLIAPGLLATLWVAVILTVLSPGVHRVVRYTVATAAVVLGAVRAGLYLFALGQLVPFADPVLAALEAVPALAGPLLLAVWAVTDAVRRGQQAPEQPVVEHVVTPFPPPLVLPPVPERAMPSSPTTPVTAGVARRAESSPQSPQSMWSQVGSPWPRAVEDDPDGTLLRPPRRRNA